MKREPPEQLTPQAQLLVEGSDPKNLFRAFCKKWSLSRIQIHDFGGNRDLRPYLKAFIKATGFNEVTRLGIIRDAEESASAALGSVHGALGNAGLPVPDKSGESSPGPPTVSVLILPDGDQPGNLESLLWSSVETEPEAGCVDEYLACLKLGNLSVAHRDKIRVLAYLAGRKPPTDSLGVAARKKYWDPEHEAFARIRQFLTTLNTG